MGREIRLDDTSYTVIGIMPGGFENVVAPAAALWTTLQYDPSLPAQGREWGHHLRTIGRLRPGTSADIATREVVELGRAMLQAQRPETYDPTTVCAVPLQAELVRGIRPALLAILGAVVLVLVIAAVNVTNLLLARGVQRRGEFALRAALGAGRTRLIRQVLTENLILAALGGAGGMAVAISGVRALVALGPPGLPRAGAIAVNDTVFAFGLGLTTLVGLASGCSRAAGGPHRSASDSSAPDGFRAISGVRSALVVAEVALALVLLVSSGLLLPEHRAPPGRSRRLRLVDCSPCRCNGRPPIRRGRCHVSVLRAGARGRSPRSRRHGGIVRQSAAPERRPGYVRRTFRCRQRPNDDVRRFAMR